MQLGLNFRNKWLFLDHWNLLKVGRSEGCKLLGTQCAELQILLVARPCSMNILLTSYALEWLSCCDQAQNDTFAVPAVNYSIRCFLSPTTTCCQSVLLSSLLLLLFSLGGSDNLGKLHLLQLRQSIWFLGALDLPLDYACLLQLWAKLFRCDGHLAPLGLPHRQRLRTLLPL